MAPEMGRSWKTLAVEQLSDQLFRLPLPVPWAEVGGVNCYLWRDEAGSVLVDPGWAYPPGRETLDRHLAELDVAYRDILTMVVTHQHADHFSRALELRDELGVPLLLGREEEMSLSAALPCGPNYAAQVGRLAEYGDTELADANRVYRETGPQVDLPYGLADRWVDDGDVVEIGANSLTIVATPGHTRGHIAIEVPENGLLTGDHVLPHIPTSAGIERDPDDSPLTSYLTSLRILLDRPDSAYLPAHGPPSASTHERVTSLLSYHERRLEGIRNDVAALGVPVTAAALARSRRWTRQQQHYDALPLLRRVAAILDIGTHLDELTRRGVLTMSRDAQSVRHYRC